MARECAFCPETAKLSGEHLWSAWMEELIPGKKLFTSWNARGEIAWQRVAAGLDWTAKVVCKRCNETWMSDIESRHAKPAMADLILGETEVTISRSRAHSMAVFAFKAAVVLDHMQRKREPFFVRPTRDRFRESLALPPPPMFGIWIAGFLRRGHGEAIAAYGEGHLSPKNRVKVFVCTYSVGHLVLQAVAARQQGFEAFLPSPEFNHVAQRLWPFPNDSAPRWPPLDVIRTVSELRDFSGRWRTILPVVY